MIGSTLAHYRITAALGEGGMGEVWRAEDTKLDREVALKVLPEEFAKDPERMARFEREAKVLASLNHPNIATLYGLETVSGTVTDSQTGTGRDGDPASSEAEVTFLAMELVEGEDLSERIKRGQIPVDEAAAISLQIAEALEAAHEQGIVHRDLKPANIKLRRDGAVKVLDFGLAKAWETEGPDPGLSLSPTVTRHATAAGLILGTAAYMSPEQARGTEVDRKADIWSFGVVLWEMLTGRKLFEGHTVSDVLASVLKEAPDLDALPSETPSALRMLVARCLEKEPRQRLQSIGEARIVLEGPMDEPSPVDSGDQSAVPRGRSRAAAVTAWVVTAVALVATAVVLWMNLDREPTRVLKTSIPPPEERSFHIPGIAPGPAALSPDGTKIVFSARDADGTVQLYMRSLDASQAHVMSGTEGAQYPFWSPDSRWVGFFTQRDETLKKVDAAGGPPITVCPAEDGKGGSWGSDGVIIFAPSAGEPLHRVSASGGVSEAITEIDRSRHNSHRHPRFLPDGRRFLYMARGTSSQDNTIMVGSLDGGIDKEIVRTVAQAEYASGYLFFMRDQSLMAQPFDVDALEFAGEAQPVAEATLTIVAAALGIFTVSPSGLLAYHTGEVNASVYPVWYDRSGREVGTLGDPAEYVTLSLAPNGREAALSVVAHGSGTFDIWTYDLGRDLKTRFTFDDGMDFWPVWAPDGKTLTFASDRAGSFDIYTMGIGGVRGAEPLLEADEDLYPTGWSPDGKWLVYMRQDEETGFDAWALPVADGGDPVPLRVQPGMDVPGGVSPDGNWLTYSSSESGELEVYVAPFPEASRRWQVSTSGGVYPFWCGDGEEIVYQQFDGRLMSVAVELGEDAVRLGETTPLFDISSPENLGAAYVPAADCERFLVIPPGENTDTTLLNLVVGWPQELEER